MIHIFTMSCGLAQIIVNGCDFENTGLPEIFRVGEERLVKEPMQD